MSARNERLDQLRRVIPLVTPAEALDLQHEGGTLIDIRESDEIAQGSPQQAHRIPRGFLELRIEEHLSDLEATVLVMCAGSTRSLFAAESLRQLGYRDVRVVDGGFTRWKASGLPVELPRRLKPEDHERYSRHLTIPEIGVEGQAKLLEGKVLLVGAGGLGSPAALYLAAAGVGTLGIVDDDYVDRSNLQRQVLHDDTRLGMSKVESARATLAALNPGVQVVTSNERLDIGNVERIFAGYDVILDGSDNFATRYLVNDACVKLGLPNVYGAVFRFEGQTSVFWPGRPELPGPCYRCMYPHPPPAELAPSCAEAGVLGVLPGVIGLLQAVETIKLLVGIGEPLVGRLLQYDALAARFRELKLEPDPECAYCVQGSEFPGYIDYEGFCSAG